MPKMDGIETTKILRDMGYKRPIIALTANAIAGHAEMFLENGFDGYISKPIDIRQLNASLNKLIRDIYPPEIVEAAKKQAEKLMSKPAVENADASSAASSSEMAAIFNRDAEKASDNLKTILANAFRRKDDFQDYVINIHSMKSALANIGETELSATALKLEMAGRAENAPLVMEETPAFLEALAKVIEKNRPKENAVGGENKKHGNDMKYLVEKLHIIRAACEKNDETTANKALIELKQNKWTSYTKDLLITLEELILQSDFEEAANLVKDYESIINKTI